MQTQYALVVNGIIKQLAPTQEDLEISPALQAAGVTIVQVGEGAGIGEPAVDITKVSPPASYKDK